MKLDVVTLEARTLSEAWFNSMYALFDHGREYKIQRGSFEEEDKRLEFDDFKIQITHPGERPLVPLGKPGVTVPTDQQYIDEYLAYLLTDELAKDELYTYGERLVNPMFRMIKGDGENAVVVEERRMEIDPVQYVIDNYKDGLFGQNQMTMQIGMPNDLLIKDPPCLRHIDTKCRWDPDIEKFKLHFSVYFRSWDLWGGFPSNLAGLQMLKEYMVMMIDRDDVVDGEIIADSKSLHLYGVAYDAAKAWLADKEIKGETSD